MENYIQVAIYSCVVRVWVWLNALILLYPTRIGFG